MTQIYLHILDNTITANLFVGQFKGDASGIHSIPKSALPSGIDTTLDSQTVISYVTDQGFVTTGSLPDDIDTTLDAQAVRDHISSVGYLTSVPTATAQTKGIIKIGSEFKLIDGALNIDEISRSKITGDVKVTSYQCFGQIIIIPEWTF